MAKITKQAIEALPVGKELHEGGIIYRKGKTGGAWWVSYYVGTQRKRERIGKDPVVTKKKALKALTARAGEVVQGRFDIARTEKAPLFKDFENKYVAWSKGNKKSWETDEYRLNYHLTPFFGEYSLTDITPWIVEKYRSKRAENKPAKATVNRELGILKALFNKAILWGKAKENPVRKVKFYRENNTIVRFLTENEARSLLNACNNFLKPIVLMALNTGMRQGEIFRLQWEDVDLKHGVITIRDGKDGKDAHVPINENLKAVLSELPRFDDNLHVFPGMKPGAPLNNVHHSWKTALEKAGIENFRFHDLRHTFASWLVMEGVDIYTVKDLLRHKSIEMTIRYAHLAPEHKKAAMERLGGLVEKLTDTEQTQIAETEKTSDSSLSATA